LASHHVSPTPTGWNNLPDSNRSTRRDIISLQMRTRHRATAGASPEVALLAFEVKKRRDIEA
jgi:hypothetical protein